MQFTSLLLLVLGATTLATPIDILDAPSADINSTSSTTEQHLEKRGTYGWIASFADGDSSCKGGYAEPRPQIKKDCINFSPVDGGSNIGVCLSLPTFTLPSTLPFPCPASFPTSPTPLCPSPCPFPKNPLHRSFPSSEKSKSSEN